MSSAIPQNKKVQKINWGTDSGGRQKNLHIIKPFLIGCRSKLLEAPVPNPNLNGPAGSSTPVLGKEHSHQWTLFLRSFNNEDIGVWIKSVNFILHESYPDFNRCVTKFPFEVTETGWGEFEVQVKVNFQDPHERQVNLGTMVRFFKKNTDYTPYYDKDGYLVSEYFDEFVFNEPSAMMRDLLNTRKPEAHYTNPVTDYDKLRKETTEKIRQSRKRVLKEIEAIKAQYKEYEAVSKALAAHLAMPGPLHEPDYSIENAAEQNMENRLTDL